MKAFIYITIMLFTCIESYSQKELIVFDNGTKAYKIKGGDGWGVENENGIVIVPKVYKLLECYGNFIYCKRNISNGYCELYDYNGIPKIGQSDSLKNLSFVKLKNGWIMQSSDFKFSSARFFDDMPFVFTKIKHEEDQGSQNYRVFLSGKEGVMRDDGSILIPIQYDHVYKYTTGLPFEAAYFVKEKGTTGIFTADGRMVFPTNLFREVDIKKGSDGLKFQADWYIKAYNSLGDNYYYDLNGKLLHHENLIKNVMTLIDKLSDAEKFDELCSKAQIEFDNKKYKKAIEYYSQALSIMKDDNIYYNIGAAYYNQGKYDKAIDYLNLCVSNSASQSLKKESSEMIEDCRTLIREKKERRREMWSSLITTAFSVGTAIIGYNLASKNRDDNYVGTNNSNNFFNRNTNYDYLLDPRYAMMQVQQQYYYEYLQMTNGGQTMTYEEWFQKIKGPALAEEYKMEHGLSDVNEVDSKEEYKGELSPSEYEAAYRGWERQVESWFGNLTSNGIRVQDQQGNISGKTDGEMKGWAYVGNQSGLKKAQNEMRKIRLEAEKYGVIIQQSKWETASVRY